MTGNPDARLFGPARNIFLRFRRENDPASRSALRLDPHTPPGRSAMRRTSAVRSHSLAEHYGIGECRDDFGMLHSGSSAKDEDGVILTNVYRPSKESMKSAAPTLTVFGRGATVTASVLSTFYSIPCAVHGRAGL